MTNRTAHLYAQPINYSNRNRSWSRAFIQFLFSNLGLVIVVVAYSIGGAFLFILLEQYIELQNCQQGKVGENVSVTNLSETMYNYVVLSGDNQTVMYDQMEDYLANFTTDIYARKDQLRYTGQDCDTVSGWSFPSAMLFTITVITTIGYGHITPVSWEGQITCICYALIGIPIFLLCLANISSVLGDIFRFMYSALLHCCCCVCRSYTRNRRRRRKISERDGADNQTNNWASNPSEQGWGLSTSGGLKTSAPGEEEDEEEDAWDRLESRVPFGAVIAIIIGYLCLGAFMFSHFEDWTMTEAVYFCYITLSTIGFGDYVPGLQTGAMSGLRFILGSIYILFGLALLAMCFDLIKEGIVDKFKWFAYKFGIAAIDDEEDLEYDDNNGRQNYEYEQRQQTSAKKREADEPPSYNDGRWSRNLKEKTNEPSKRVVSSPNAPEHNITPEKH
ncbi:unnamed protein product [Didymodactylos carnosus]|uniref:Potassium channel domain-containing protein n=1 Tax=Didymodactylos carnosus TaxID=1234261 RepID=A0A8S2CPM2_9BILA|nr:unnamed protein product [Didymodactylos carnosus]CAF3506564.1 unnamed protein product [Didymodactylos carnosus]